MLKAVMVLLVSFKVISTTSQTYSILNFMADSAFYFLPFLLANSAAKKFKCNTYMAMTLAAGDFYPYSCNPKDVMEAMRKDRENILFIDVQSRGEYPGYAKRFFRENNIDIQMEENDKKF